LQVTVVPDVESLPPHVDEPTWRRFCSSILIIPSGCHLWTGPADADGHGRFWAEDRIWPAHTFAWHAWHGPSPRSRPIVHLCGHPLCAPTTRDTVETHLSADHDVESRATLIQHREAGLRRLSAARHAHLAVTRATQSASLDAVLAAAIEQANGSSEGPPLS
jgi:hypothetical protein